MARSDYEGVVEQVKGLSRAEWWRLRDLLTVWLRSPQRPMTEEELTRELVKKGILTVPPPLTDFTSHQSWKPIEIEGKPLSETVIEERR